MRLRGGRAERLLGLAIPVDDQLEYLGRLEFGVEVDGDGHRGDRAGSPPLRRHPRGGPDRGGRAGSTATPRTCRRPSRRRPPAGGLLTREQRLRRRAEDLARDLGFDGVVTLSLIDPGEAERLRLGDEDPRAQPIAISNPLSGEHSVLRTTLLGGLLDVARYNLARGAHAVALCESGRAYLRAGEPVGGGHARAAASPATVPRPRTSPGGSRAWPAARRPATAGGASRRSRTSTRSRGRSRASPRGLGCSVEVEPSTEPFLAPGRAGRVLVGRRRGGLGRGDPPAGLPGLGPRGRDRIRARPRAAGGRLADRQRALRGRDHLSGGGAGHRRRRRRGGRGGAGARGRGRGRRRAPAVDRGLRPLPRRAARGGGTRASPCGWSSAPPTGPSPTRRSRSCASGSRRRWPRSEGSLRELTSSRPGWWSPGASGYAGALAAELVWRHPRLELAAATSRTEAGTRLDRLYPRYRCPIELTELDLTLLEDVDAAIVAYPHGAAAPVVAEMRGLGLQVVDLSADFRLVDAAIYERWYAPARRARAARQRGLRAHRARPRPDPRRPSWSPTPAAIRPRRCWRWRRWPSAGCCARSIVDAKSGVSGAGPGRGSRPRSSTWPRTSSPYGVDGHRHLPEIEQELRRLRAPTSPVTLRPAPAADRPGAAGELLRRPEREPADGARGAVRRALRRRAVRRGDRVAARACARSATRTSAGSTPRRSASGRAVVFAAIDNLWKGAAGQAIQNLNLMLGLDEAEGLR